MYTTKHVGERLKAIRENLGFSQFIFAAKAEIREKAYWQYENHKAMIPIDKLVRLANAHEFSIEKLFKAEKGDLPE